MDRPSDMQPARAEPIRLTYGDYLRFPNDGRRHELIDGEQIVTPTPVLRHQELLGRLFLALGNYLERHPVGEVYTAPLDVILSDHDVVQPDLLFVSNDRRDVLQDWVRGAPDLVVEILSPSTRRTDEVAKRHLYDRFGVREYWVVDPEIEIVKIYRRAEAGSFVRAGEPGAESGDVLETVLLPGFSMNLRALFA
jgi:Uma2 family endonuclease